MRNTINASDPLAAYESNFNPGKAGALEPLALWKTCMQKERERERERETVAIMLILLEWSSCYTWHLV